MEQVSDAGSPVLAIVGKTARRRLPHPLVPIAVGVAETRRFHAGFVGLKGEVVAHLLRELTDRPTLIDDPEKLAATAVVIAS